MIKLKRAKSIYVELNAGDALLLLVGISGSPATATRALSADIAKFVSITEFSGNKKRCLFPSNLVTTVAVIDDTLLD